MKTEKIGETKLICDFMGYEFIAERLGYMRPLVRFNKVTRGATFHQSWDQLMPIVEKIQTLAIAIEISFSLATICKICYKKGHHFEWITVEDNDRIGCVYSACLEFIKWYNSNPESQGKER